MQTKPIIVGKTYSYKVQLEFQAKNPTKTKTTFTKKSFDLIHDTL